MICMKVLEDYDSSGFVCRQCSVFTWILFSAIMKNKKPKVAAKIVILLGWDARETIESDGTAV